MPQDDAVGNPASPCPGPCDVAIPLVYPHQLIKIPAAAVAENIPFDLDIDQSFRDTFTDPNARPPLSIARRSGRDVYVDGLGHAGIAMINGRTGEVAYYEYGRYDAANFGLVREVPAVASVSISFDDSGNPTTASRDALMRALTRTNGGPYAFEAVYVKLANGAFDTMKTFADTRKADVAAHTAAAYDVGGNHCFTFAMETAASAGVSTAAAQSAPTLELRLAGGNMLTRGITGAMAPSFEVPARQILAMQNRYRALSVSSGGAVGSGFEYPTGLNSR